MPENLKPVRKGANTVVKKQKIDSATTETNVSSNKEQEQIQELPNVESQPEVEKSKSPINYSDRNILFLGVGLIALGLLIFLGRLLSIPFGEFLWPFIFIIPGTLLLFSALSSDSSSGEGLSILGAILSSLGALFLFQQLSGLWATWAYAWALIAPTSVGIAQILYGNRQKREKIILAGKKLVTIGLLITGIGFIFFELILGLSNLGGDLLDGFRLPLGLILFGLFVLARSIINRRK